jgi:apolipoprotein N-acyltransferase
VGARLGPPLLSGILLAAATPPALSPLLPFVALVPLAVHLARLPVGGGGTRALEAGALTALVQHGWGLRWLPGTLTDVAGLVTGSAAALAVLLTLAGFGGAATWCVHRLGTGAPRPRTTARSAGRLAVGLALAWTALDWTLAHLPLGLPFPWAPLGLGLARWPAALGVAELLGVTGVTAWLAAVNGLLAAALLRWTAGDVAPRRRGRRAAPVLAAAAVAALVPVGWGWWRAATLRSSEPSAALVALALDVHPDRPPEARAEAAVAAAEELLADVLAAPDLIVLPEMALPVDLESPLGAELAARLERAGDVLDAPVLVGVRTTRGGRAYNTALLLDEVRFRADKRRLVPGAERGSPLAAAWLAPTSSGYAAGEESAVLESGPLVAGVLVCFEVAFADDVRRLVRSGARALVVISNDGWFGGVGAHDRAQAAGVAQQLAHLVMRVVETRIGAARSANGGPAAWVSRDGRVVLEEPPAALLALPTVTGPVTLFVRTGDWIGPLAVAALLFLLALPRHPGHPGTPLAGP